MNDTLRLSSERAGGPGLPRIGSRPTWLALLALLLLLLLLASPAAAQWSRVTQLPASDIFSVWANGDTIAAAADTAVYVSTDGGVTWKRSAKVTADVTMIRVVRVHNGRVYAGTFGQGMFVSDDLGTTWLDFNQGLVSGFNNAEHFIKDLAVDGDTLYAATDGAGAWVRNLASGSWALFGDRTLQDFSARDMDAIAVGGSRLFAAGGFNGTVFVRDPGQPDWTVSLLFNDHFAPGLAGLNALWTGTRWIVASNIGIFHSTTGQEPWTFVDFGLHSLFFSSLAMRGNQLFASLGAGGGSLIASSVDDGVTWQNTDTLVAVGVYRLAIHGNDLYAGRTDGLWRRSIDTASVPGEGIPARLRFAIAGAQPVGDHVRFRFELPAPGPIVLEVFDVAGRRADTPIRSSWPAGPHEITWDARKLGSGVYLARLTAGGEHATVQLIRIR